LHVLIIDNYDSFTYNLVQLVGTLGADVTVRRNDELGVDEARSLAPDRIIISPGPGRPRHAGVSRDLIRAAAGTVPLLGVCLGHQCLAEVFGALVRRGRPCHGKTSWVDHDGRGVFRGLDPTIEVARYHSLVVDPDTVRAPLHVTAWSRDGTVMGLRHEHCALEGIQFHPESFMTSTGARLMRSFLDQDT
jgi:anthranilate synthase/aminodeoxychorismate synthase-like glutamine amidotransferase